MNPDFTDKKLRHKPNPLLWFNDDPNLPIHRIDRNPNKFSLTEFAENEDCWKYYEAYDEYVKSYYSHIAPSKHRALTNENLKEAKLTMLEYINKHQ